MFEISNLRRVAGKHVVGPGGERIGKVVDVYESTAGGGGTWATVATGLFGTSASFFPLDEARLEGDDLVVPYSKDVIKSAPRVDTDEELSAPDEQRLFEHYDRAGSREPGAGTGSALGTSRPDSDGSVVRSQEQLTVDTRQVEVARARLRKYVVTETVTRTVPVTHEELRVTRETIPERERDAAATGMPLSEGDFEVVLTAERAVVHKEVVPIERVRLDTVTVQGQETVTEELRTEQVELEGGPSGTDRGESRR